MASTQCCILVLVRVLLRRTAIVGSSSIISVLVGIVSAKVLALAVGPIGIGYLDLLQKFLGFVVIPASLGMGPVLVKHGAPLWGAGRHADFLRIRLAALLSAGLGAVVLAAAIALLRSVVVQAVFAGVVGSQAMLWVAFALIFTVQSNILKSAFSARQEIRLLSSANVAGSMTMAIALVVVILRLGIDAVPLAVFIGAIGTWAVTLVVGNWSPKSTQPRFVHKVSSLASQMWGLMKDGSSYALSSLAGSGATMAVPFVVLWALSATDVGYYRAAAAISVGYLGILLRAMSQEYFPRVAAAIGDSEMLERTLGDQHRLLMLVGYPVVLITLGLAPILVPLLFDASFAPAIGLLQLQLIGDVPKLTSWSYSFVLLARSGTRYMIAETVAGVTLVAGSWVFSRMFGLYGIGIGYLITYIVHLGAVVWLAREIPGARLPDRSWISVLLAVLLTGALQAVWFLGRHQIHAVAAIALGATLLIRGLWRIRQSNE